MSHRILYVENGAYGGGSAESLYQLLEVLDRRHFEPRVVFTSLTPYVKKVAAIGAETMVMDDWYFSCPSGPFRAWASRLASAVVVHGANRAPVVCLALDRKLTAKLRRKLTALIRRDRVDLVHTNNNAHRDLWVLEAAHEAGVPCVSHLRSFHAFGFSKLRAEWVNRCASAFIGYSRSIVDYWLGVGLDPQRMYLVHNAIGLLREVPAELGAMFGIPDGSPVIGIVGRVIPERGHDFLLRALPRLHRRFPSLHLLVVGSGNPSDLRALQTLAGQLGVAARVIFTGYRSDARRIIAALDAIVLPYGIEPFGRTVLEAWQLGTPVVLSRVGHVAEIVSDGEDSLLFGLDGPDELVGRLESLLLDPGLRMRLASRGRETCRARFSIESHRDAIQAIYRKLLQTKIHSSDSR